MKKILSLILVLILVSSVLTGCGDTKTTAPKVEKVKLNLGNMITEIDGNTNVTELKFATDEEMLATMQKACENNKFELYYNEDNMSIALKEKESGKILLSNPFNAALDQNYSGNVANRLNSQVIVTYLEEEKSLVDMYSSANCADLGQYKIKTYDNGLAMELSIGEEHNGNNVPNIFPKKSYEEILKVIDEDSKELLEVYYTLYKKSDLKDVGIYDIYPDIKTEEDVYYCDFEFSERDIRKLSTVFEDAGYTKEKLSSDTEKLNLGKSINSYPNFKLNLNYTLTESGINVSIPNESISYNEDFPLLKIVLLPYFAAEEAGENANGYLFIPDGTGAVINMNQNEPNRRTIITGKVYGENYSSLQKKTAVEKTEQYYLPVFGTVRNNNTAIFGVISSGDANSEITAILGRPNGNYYTTYPGFIIADHEKYTRVSVVSNAWSNKEMYLYDKNTSKEDLSVEYYFLKDEKANYSSMASIYRNHLYKETKETKKAVLNIETLGSVLTEKSILGFDYTAETVLTDFEQNIEILKELDKNNANNVSLQLKGWQKDGLDTVISNVVRVSSDLGGKSGLKKLIEYCNSNKINLSLNNNISFVKFDGSADGFKANTDATRTLELQYAKNSKLSPDTMQYDLGSYVVKASSYNNYLTDLVKSAKKLNVSSLNIGELGNSLNADYTKDNGINRSQSLSYIKETLKNNKNASLSFDGGNAYVLPCAKAISNISNNNSGFIGETASVPFLQMVIGENATHTSKPINLKENTRYELLNCIESGTIPSFLVSYDNTSYLKGTEYTAFFSVDYEILKDEILESYKYVENFVSKTDGTAVVEHNVLANDVTVSTYGNGTIIYVNKSSSDFSVDGIIVPAMDYLIKE